MIARNIVIVIFLSTLCLWSSTPGVTGTVTPENAKRCYYEVIKNSKKTKKPAPWGKSCGNGNHCDGCGTCCEPGQTNPSSCQRPPIQCP